MSPGVPATLETLVQIRTGLGNDRKVSMREKDQGSMIGK